jgi:hypothetical protein
MVAGAALRITRSFRKADLAGAVYAWVSNQDPLWTGGAAPEYGLRFLNTVIGPDQTLEAQGICQRVRFEIVTNL